MLKSFRYYILCFRIILHHGLIVSVILNITYLCWACKYIFVGRNKLLVIGGNDEEVAVVRKAIENRWPYPIAEDRRISARLTYSGTKRDDESTKEAQSPKSYEQIWLFKLKRYPWAISYGSKKVDRAVETARHLLPHISFSSPQNMDPDSGKSLLIFILKVFA